MNAIILPDEDDFAIDPSAKEAFDTAKAEVTFHQADHNDGRFGGEFNLGTQFDSRATPAASAEERTPEPEDDLPPEFRGKSQAEMARMHSEAQRTIDHQGRELAQIRRQIQSTIEEATSRAPAATVPAKDVQDEPIDDVEFFRSPQEAVARAVERHPVISGLKTAITETLQKKTTDQFHKEFSDANTTMADPEFRAWASASPIRMELLKNAHEKYDLEAAREVFGTWKALRAVATPAKQNGKTKVYRRSDLVRLNIEDPARYEQLEGEIARAYRENRVKDF